ncbi:hypothetical protein [Niallia endozanthoxylica]|uniref:hypothetical protein n=1 Tax=Niallia endozanthoxylica TaxID=2036016 RepID=UPI00168BF877|nr:hypothetical protein [Niallia endozanthoxylica]
MEPTRDEKAMRLHDMLQEALKPMIDKLEKMEQEMKALQESQEELKKILAEKTIK